MSEFLLAAILFNCAYLAGLAVYYFTQIRPGQDALLDRLRGIPCVPPEFGRRYQAVVASDEEDS